MELPFTEPFKIKMVENLYSSTKEQREKWIEEASFNLFNLKSEQVLIDLPSSRDFMKALIYHTLNRGSARLPGWVRRSKSTA
jgi:hypothetical protein